MDVAKVVVVEAALVVVDVVVDPVAEVVEETNKELLPERLSRSEVQYATTALGPVLLSTAQLKEKYDPWQKVSSFDSCLNFSYLFPFNHSLLLLLRSSNPSLVQLLLPLPILSQLLASALCNLLTLLIFDGQAFLVPL